jgi:hypothetical protein
MDETTQKIRDFVNERVAYMIQQGMTLDAETMNLYVQFKILDMLDSIDSRLISLEDEISKLNPEYK